MDRKQLIELGTCYEYMFRYPYVYVDIDDKVKILKSVKWWKKNGGDLS